MNHSWSFDRSEFKNPEKEISSLLSTAQDSILQPTDDEANYSSEDEIAFNRKLDNKYRSNMNYDRNGNPYQASSTPLHPRTLNTSNDKYKIPILKSDSRGQSKYFSMNENDEESFIGARSRISPKVSNGHKNRQKENYDVQSAGSLLIENDHLSKNLLSLNDKCTTMSSNYEALQDKFNELYNVNEKNVEVIEKLQAKVRSLESRVKEEVEEKKSAKRSVAILEESLDNLHQQYRNSDSYSKTNESHRKTVEALKQNYKKELNSIRKEVDNLRERLHEKDEEIELQASNFRQSLYNEIHAKLKKEQELENKNKKSILDQFDERIANLKEAWQGKLIEDVQKIILWLSDSVREEDMEPMAAPNTEIHFQPLQELCDYLNCYLKERENRIQIQIAEFHKTRKLLEDTLLQSQMSSCSVAETDVLAELEEIKEQNVRITQKLGKYKECYKALSDKHRKDIDQLKEEFKRRMMMAKKEG